MTDGIYSVQPIGGSSIVDTFCNMDTVLDDGADDCLQWYQYGYRVNGVYTIKLSNGTSTGVQCDQQGGGWTVFQHRHDATVSFYRGWAEYVNGFGDVSGNYWLGLEAIYLLAKQPSLLRIDMESFGDVFPPTAYAQYTGFTLQPAADKYRLLIDAFSGDCGDSLSFHDTAQFSTYDNNNDGNYYNNAYLYQGAWWYWQTGHRSNLNGLYRGYENGFATGMIWAECWGYHYSMESCTLKVKRV